MLRDAVVYGYSRLTVWTSLTILHGVFFFFFSKRIFSLLQRRVLRRRTKQNPPTKGHSQAIVSSILPKVPRSPFFDRPSIVTDTSGITICRLMAPLYRPVTRLCRSPRDVKEHLASRVTHSRHLFTGIIASEETLKKVCNRMMIELLVSRGEAGGRLKVVNVCSWRIVWSSSYRGVVVPTFIVLPPPFHSVLFLPLSLFPSSRALLSQPLPSPSSM